MFNVRSRAGVVAVTTSAAVLLAVPVVAAGQVPGVDQVVGGVQETAETLVPAPAAPALPAPPVSAPAPAPAPKPQSAPAPAPAQAAPAPSAPASTPAATGTQRASASDAAAASSGSKASSAKVSAAGSGKSRKRGGSGGGAREVAGASQAASDEAPTDVAIASQAVDAPEDASPATLPFTGLQLLLMGMLGMAALAGGLVLRRAGR